MSGKKIELYHYTTEEGAEGIQKEGKIRQLTDVARDVVLGPGTYFTDMARNKFSKTAIARNNYDYGTLPQQKLESGNLDRCLKLETDEKEEKKGTKSGRSIYCSSGDVDLKGRKYEILKVEYYGSQYMEDVNVLMIQLSISVFLLTK